MAQWIWAVSILSQICTGPRLNIKTIFPRYGIPILKIRRSQDRLIFNMGIPLPVRRHRYIETPPWCLFHWIWLILNRQCILFCTTDNYGMELNDIILMWLQTSAIHVNCMTKAMTNVITPLIKVTNAWFFIFNIVSHLNLKWVARNGWPQCCFSVYLHNWKRPRPILALWDFAYISIWNIYVNV